MKKSTLRYTLAAAALVYALSPQVRQATKRLFARSTGAVLDNNETNQE